MFEFLLVFTPVISVILIAFLALLIINVCNKLLVNQTKAKEIKQNIKEINKRMKLEQKKGNTGKVSEIMSETMKENSKLMRMQMKPLIVSMLIIILFLSSLSSQYVNVTIALLPFPLPFLGTSLGWFSWYLLVSIPIALLLRKLLKIAV